MKSPNEISKQRAHIAGSLDSAIGPGTLACTGSLREKFSLWIDVRLASTAALAEAAYRTMLRAC
jgi:hypothetical protein